MHVHIAILSPPYSILTYALPAYFPQSAWHLGQRVVVPVGKSLRVGVIVDFLQQNVQKTTDDEGVKNNTSQAVVHGDTQTEAGEKSALISKDTEQNKLSEGKVKDKKDEDTTDFEKNAPAKKVSLENAPSKNTYTLKNILWPIEVIPLLHSAYIEMAEQLALRHSVSIGRILGHLVPAGLRSAKVRLRFFGEGLPENIRLNQLAEKTEDEKKRLAELWLTGHFFIASPLVDPLDTEMCALAKDPPWPVKPAATKQTAMLEYLFEKGAVTKKRLQRDLGKSSSAILRTLVERSLVRLFPATSVCNSIQEEVSSFQESAEQGGVYIDPLLRLPPAELLPLHYTLTAHQQEAFLPLLQSLQAEQAETSLLFGLTGSGKTAIYLELARQCLLMGKSVLLLAPEVALAYKLWDDAAISLQGADRFLFHGYQTPAVKEATFVAIATHKKPCVVIGTRSALFLPTSSLGLIVLDEEHDASFKQDEGFIYQAKEVAWYKAGQEKALLLLGSATPDIKTYHAATNNVFPIQRLNERVGGGSLPNVTLVPLQNKGGGIDLLANESKTALKEVVEKGEQAIILLNRRGYSPQMYCLQCGRTAKCPHCDISLAYHKARERLICHYCNYNVPFPSTCVACNGLHFLPLGEGTEKIEETLQSLLPPGTEVLRLDRDSTRRPGRLEEILARFARKQASVLVGTQMLSKGHHFPNVTLAIMADADLGLNLPDYRSAERTFQLLLQTAGRAGRGEKMGRVLIQTRDVKHYCWQYVQEADYQGFYDRELALREQYKYPPFVRLALIRMTYPVQEIKGQEEVMRLGKILREKSKEFGVRVLGPAPSPIPVLQGRRRFYCLVKAGAWQPVRSLFNQIVSKKPHKILRISLDLDPVNLL